MKKEELKRAEERSVWEALYDAGKMQLVCIRDSSCTHPSPSVCLYCVVCICMFDCCMIACICSCMFACTYLIVCV